MNEKVCDCGADLDWSLGKIGSVELLRCRECEDAFCYTSVPCWTWAAAEHVQGLLERIVRDAYLRRGEL